jgi:hypothetical protein
MLIQVGWVESAVSHSSLPSLRTRNPTPHHNQNVGFRDFIHSTRKPFHQQYSTQPATNKKDRPG